MTPKGVVKTSALAVAVAIGKDTSESEEE